MLLWLFSLFETQCLCYDSTLVDPHYLSILHIWQQRYFVVMATKASFQTNHKMVTILCSLHFFYQEMRLIEFPLDSS